MPSLLSYLSEKVELNEADRVSLADPSLSRAVSKNDFLLQPGAKESSTFFVESGLLRLYAMYADGKEHIIQFACEGWFISDRNSVHFGEPASFYIEAIEDSKVVELSDDLLDQRSEGNEAFRRFNELALQNHIRHLQNRIGSLLGAPAKERYQGFLALYPDLFNRVPQWMIASYLGITPESLSRVRRELTKG